VLYVSPYKYPVPCENSNFLLENQERHLLVCFKFIIYMKKGSSIWWSELLLLLPFTNQALEASYMTTYTESKQINNTYAASKQALKLTDKEAIRAEQIHTCIQASLLFSSCQQSGMLLTTMLILYQINTCLKVKYIASKTKIKYEQASWVPYIFSRQIKKDSHKNES
jgi:hypothetical protein